MVKFGSFGGGRDGECRGVRLMVLSRTVTMQGDFSILRHHLAKNSSLSGCQRYYTCLCIMMGGISFCVKLTWKLKHRGSRTSKSQSVSVLTVCAAKRWFHQWCEWYHGNNLQNLTAWFWCWRSMRRRPSRKSVLEPANKKHLIGSCHT